MLDKHPLSNYDVIFFDYGNEWIQCEKENHIQFLEMNWTKGRLFSIAHEASCVKAFLEIQHIKHLQTPLNCTIEIHFKTNQLIHKSFYENNKEHIRFFELSKEELQHCWSFVKHVCDEIHWVLHTPDKLNF